MRYLVFFSALALLAAGLLSHNALLNNPSFDAAFFALTAYVPVAITVIFVLMAHSLAVLTVSKQRSALGNFGGIAGRYPEVPVPFLVLASWITIGALTQPTLTALATGFIFAVALAVCYVLVRVVRTQSVKSTLLSAPTPGFSSTSIARLATRGIYMLRILIASVSAYGLLFFAFTENIMNWLSAFAIVVIFAAALLAFCGTKYERALAQKAGKTAKQAIAAQLALQPTELALYYSGAVTSKHTAPFKLASRLAKEGIPITIIIREAGVRKFLAKAPCQYVWFCPTIDTLDAVAQPELKVIFYVNDAAKNGHFIRFNDYVHILQATGTIAAEKFLPQSCAVYDAIIAPDEVKADAWREVATPDMAKRIVTVGKNSSTPNYLPARKYPEAQPVVTLHLGGQQYLGDREALIDRLSNLIRTVKQDGVARLEIWFPPAKDGAHEPALRRLHRAVEKALPIVGKEEDEATEVSLVTRHTGTPVAAANAADFPIATSASDLVGLRRSGKPLLWFDTDDLPDGFIQLQENTDGFSEALDLAWNEPAHQTSMGFEAGHFGSLTELIEAVKYEEFGSEQAGPTS
jgi:hypothetical protein